MGASKSRLQAEQSLKLCRDRKKYAKRALDGWCVLAEAHVIYIQSLKNTGRILREYFEPGGLIEPDLHDSTAANKRSLVPNDNVSNSLTNEEEEEEKSSPVVESVTMSYASHNTTRHPNEKLKSVTVPSPPHAEILPWEYFDLSISVDNHKINGSSEGIDHACETKTTLNIEEEGNANELSHNIFESESEEEIIVLERNDFNESDTDSNQALHEGVVGSFKNINMAAGIIGLVSSPCIGSASNKISDIFPMGRIISPDLSPLREIASSVSTPVHLTKLTDIEETDIQDHIVACKASTLEFYSSMKNIEQLFLKASECGQEVLKMLEANKLYFYRTLPKQNGGPKISWCLIACFSNQEEHYQVSHESGFASKRWLTSQRNFSARSFSSIESHNPKDVDLVYSSNDIYCLKSGSHVSTLERLYAWEKKLYEEVKASQVVRRRYDQMCKVLRDQESKAQSVKRVDKTRAEIKDLHSRIRVSLKRMETISQRIIRIRDSELQPQFEELIKGLSNMWQKMHECHKHQCEIISAALSYSTKIAINSENRKLIRYHLEQHMCLISWNVTGLIAAYLSYMKEIEGWLIKCVLFPEKSSKKTSKHQHMPISEYSQPIFITCRNWLEGLEKLAAETSRLLPRQDKHQHVNLEKTEQSVDKSLMQFLSQLKMVSESSGNMFEELDKSNQEANSKYEQKT